MQLGAQADVFGQLPVLETDRLVLRPLCREDAADIFAYASDPAVAKYTRWSAVGHTSLADTHAFLDTVLHAYAAGYPAPWGIMLKATGKIIGVCGFLQWRPQHRWAEVAYALSRSYWGKGLITEAVHEVLHFGFATRQLERIQATCYSDHEASCRVLHKVGMTLEGVLRHCVFVDGAYRDLKVFGMLRSEWADLHLMARRAELPQHNLVLGQVFAQ